MADSCRDTTCGPGEKIGTDGVCHEIGDYADDGEMCKVETRIKTPNSQTNCCIDGVQDSWGNCCDTTTGEIIEVTYSTDQGYYPDTISGTIESKDICVPKDTSVKYVLTFEPDTITYYPEGTNMLICLGTMTEDAGDTTVEGFPSGDTLTCDGQYIVITSNGMYYSPQNASTYPTLSYQTDDGATTCTLTYDGTTWEWSSTGTTQCATINNTTTLGEDYHYRVTYKNPE